MRTPFLLFLAVPLLLASCGGSSSETAASCDMTYWDGTIGTCIPDKWKVLTREELEIRGMPPEVVVAFQADEAITGQFPTVTVTRRPLASEADSAVYSDAAKSAVEQLPGYEAIDDETVDVDGADVTLYTFAAQPLPEQPKQRFSQVSAVKDNIGFTFTGSLPLGVEQKEQQGILLILRNMTFEGPGTEEGK